MLQLLFTPQVSSLKRKLRNRATLLGDGVSRAFLQALVQLIGGYRDALRFYQGEKITFNPDAFVESRPPSIQPFLRKMLELQIFQQVRFLNNQIYISLLMLNIFLVHRGALADAERGAWFFR